VQKAGEALQFVFCNGQPMDSSDAGRLKVQKAGEVLQLVFCNGQPIAENQLPAHCRVTSAAGG